MSHSPASTAFSLKSILYLTIAGGLNLSMLGCSQQQAKIAPTPPPMPPMVVAIPHPSAPAQVTTASWYGPGFHGRHTSNGEVYNQGAMTAASRTLPIGAHAQVTNLSTGKSVVVRINDHGPYVKGRGIDLSRAAAKRIGMDHRGVAQVKVTRVDGHSDVVHSEGRHSEEAKTATLHHRHVTDVDFASGSYPAASEASMAR